MPHTPLFPPCYKSADSGSVASNVTRAAAGHAPLEHMQVVSSVKRRLSTLPAETQLNAAVIKRHIMFQTTSSIISETAWSSNAFSLAS